MILRVNLVPDRPPNVAALNKGKRVFDTARLQQQTWRTNTHKLQIPVQPVLLRGWGCLLIHTRYAGGTLANVAAAATAGRTFGNVGTSGTLGSVPAGGTVGNVATGGTLVM